MDKKIFPSKQIKIIFNSNNLKSFFPLIHRVGMYVDIKNWQFAIRGEVNDILFVKTIQILFY